MNRYSRVHAEIDLDAILHNMEAMHGNISGNTKIMAVIKADGYGHGAVEIAEAIDHLDYLCGYAVATVEEGLILRNHGIKKPILILGYAFPDQYRAMIRARIRPTVFTREMAESLSCAADALDMDCPIHFAVDTGMSRIGYQVTEEAADEMAQLAQLPHIMVEGIFTHFARADEADKSHARRQIELFLHMIEMLAERGVSIPASPLLQQCWYRGTAGGEYGSGARRHYPLWSVAVRGGGQKPHRSKTGALACDARGVRQDTSGGQGSQLRRNLHHRD